MAIGKIFGPLVAMFKKESWNFLRDRSTDWAHLEIMRLGTFSSLAALLGFTGWILYLKGTFDANGFADAVMKILGIGGATTATKYVAQNHSSVTGRSTNNSGQAPAPQTPPNQGGE